MARKDKQESMLCISCGAKCCRYVTVPIEAPRTQKDFDRVRWYLIHKNVRVAVDQLEWYLEFITPCLHVTPGHVCRDYENRPQVCRDYGNSRSGCEVDGVDHSEYFKSAAEFDRWLEEGGAHRRKRR